MSSNLGRSGEMPGG